MPTSLWEGGSRLGRTKPPREAERQHHYHNEGEAEEDDEANLDMEEIGGDLAREDNGRGVGDFPPEEEDSLACVGPR